MRIYESIVNHRWTVLWMSIAVSLFGFLSFLQMPMKLLPESSEKPILVFISPKSENGLDSQITSRVYHDTLNAFKLKVSPVLKSSINLFTSHFVLPLHQPINLQEFSNRLEQNLEKRQQHAKVYSMELHPSDGPVLRIALKPKQNEFLTNPDRFLDAIEKNWLPALNKMQVVKKVEFTDGWKRQVEVGSQWLTQGNIVGLLPFLENASAFNQSLFSNHDSPLKLDVNLNPISSFFTHGQWKSNGLGAMWDGMPIILIDVYRKESVDEIKISDEIQKYIEANKSEAYEAFIVSDTASYIRAAQDNVVSNLNMGTLLTCLCVLLFVKNLNTTLIVALSIPFSILMTFPVLEWLGLSRNVMSLAGIALAVGIVVDATLSVVEGALDRVEKGKNLFIASALSASENTAPIASTSLTTLAVFIPILFLKGFVGDLFYDLAMTFIFSQIISFFVTLFLVPALIVIVHEVFAKKIFLNHGFDRNSSSELGPWKAIMMGRLKRMMQTPFECITINVLLLFLVVLSFLIAPPSEFLPRSQTAHYRLTVLIGKDANREQRLLVTKKLEQKLSDHQFTNRFMRESDGFILIDFDAVALNTAETNREMIQVASPYATNISAVNPLNEAASSGRDLEFFIPVEMPQRNAVKKNLSEQSGIAQQQWSKDIKQALVEASFDERNSKGYSLPSKYSKAIWNHSLAEIPLGVGWIKPHASHPFLSKYVYSPQSDQVIHPFLPEYLPDHYSYLASKMNLLPSEFYYIGGKEYEKVSLSLRDMTTSEAEEMTTRTLQKFNAPIVWDENVQRNNQGMMQLVWCIVLAFILIFIILWVQNRSAVMATIVMFTFIWGPIGAFPGLIIHGEVLNGSVLVGFILLAGTIVNNGILIVEIIQRYRRQQKHPIDCCLLAIQERAIPVIVTALTTVFGMLPMVFETGEGSQMYRGLSIIVVYGTLLSTPISLIGIPTLVMVFDHLRELFFRASLRSQVLVTRPIAFFLQRSVK